MISTTLYKKITIAALGAVLLTGAAPATSFAHGGGHDGGGRGGQQHQSRNDDRQQSNNWRGHGRHDGRGWGMYCLSAEKFQQRYDAILAKLDSVVADNDLTVANGEALRANVVSSGATAKIKITELKALKDSYNNTNVTDEQRDAFKAKLAETRTALMDYRNALRAYKQAIKDAAVAANVEVSFKVSSETK